MLTADQTELSCLNPLITASQLIETKLTHFLAALQDVTDPAFPRNLSIASQVLCRAASVRKCLFQLSTAAESWDNADNRNDDDEDEVTEEDLENERIGEEFDDRVAFREADQAYRRANGLSFEKWAAELAESADDDDKPSGLVHPAPEMLKQYLHWPHTPYVPPSKRTPGVLDMSDPLISKSGANGLSSRADYSTSDATPVSASHKCGRPTPSGDSSSNVGAGLRTAIPVSPVSEIRNPKSEIRPILPIAKLPANFKFSSPPSPASASSAPSAVKSSSSSLPDLGALGVLGDLAVMNSSMDSLSSVRPVPSVPSCPIPSSLANLESLIQTSARQLNIPNPLAPTLASTPASTLASTPTPSPASPGVDSPPYTALPSTPTAPQPSASRPLKPFPHPFRRPPFPSSSSSRPKIPPSSPPP